MKPDEAYHIISRRLHAVRQREKMLRLLEGCLYFLFLTGVIGIFLLIAESLFHFSPLARCVICAALFIVWCYFLARWVIGRVFSLLRRGVPDDIRLALRIGSHFKEIKDRLADGIQVFRALSRPRGTSEELAGASLISVFHRSEKVDFREIIPKRMLAKSIVLLFAMIVFGAMVLILFFKPVTRAWGRLRTPWMHTAEAPGFTVHPGNISVIQGEDVEISVQSLGASLPEELTLVLRHAGGETWRRIMRMPHRYTLNSVQETLYYSVQGGTIHSEEYTVQVMPRPMIRSLQVWLHPPAYTRKGSIILEANEGNIDALKGTQVRLWVGASKPISAATLSFENGSRKSLAVNGTDAEGRFLVTSENAYTIALSDTSGLTNTDAISYCIRVQPDLSPVAQILAPAQDVDLDESMRVRLRFEAEDDFGISAWYLRYGILDDGKTDTAGIALNSVSLPLDEESPLKIDMDYVWDLTSVPLYPEDRIFYRLEAKDNDTVSGPKSGISRIFFLRFPSIYEILKEAGDVQDAQAAALENMVSEGREVQSALEEIVEDIKAGEEIAWEDRRSMGELAEKQKQIGEELEDLHKDLTSLLDKLEKNDLVSMETMEKYIELQKLFQEITSPELKAILEKLKNAIEGMDREKLLSAMNQFKVSQENFLKSMERTISLLKRLKVEQKMGALTKRMENLLERQQALDSALATLGEEPSPELGENERKIGRDLSEVPEEMNGLMQEMQEMQGMPLSDMERAMDFLYSSRLENDIASMERMIREGRIEEAEKLGKNGEASMRSLSEMFRAMKESLTRNQRDRVMDALRRSSYRMLQLSQNQESLILGIREGRSDQEEASRKQLSLASGVRQMADSLMSLSMETFSITPEMGRGLGEAMGAMQRSLQSMGGDLSGSILHQTNAMGALNRTVMAIQSALSQMENSQSGIGMDSFLMQLEQMSQKQSELNRALTDMMGTGTLSLEEQAGYSRLAAEQEALRKSLENLLKEYRENSEWMGRLDHLKQEMAETVEELRENKASREMVERQKRILSRLLDAQHSLQRREFEEKRQAVSGKDRFVESPRPVPAADDPWLRRIQRDILSLSREGYTKEYQEIIRLYFEALMREGNRR